jgi:SAM-dependent methyltransferase
MKVFEQYANYYDLLYSDKDYAAEVEYIWRLLNRFAPDAKSILEFGSGTGIHGRMLAEKGYKVIGMERSSEMVERANPKQSNHAAGTFECLQGDIRYSRFDETVDIVVSLFHVISYLTSNEDLTSTLRNAQHHLQAGGILLFDFWYTPAVLTQRPSVRVKRMADEKINVLRIAEPFLHPNQNVVDVNYTIYIEEKSSKVISSFKETHPMRHFSLPELEFIADQLGFIPLISEEFLTGQTPGEDTWGVCNVWKRK